MSVTAESRRRVTVAERSDRTLLVFHAERLHDDPVWRRVLPLARTLAEDGIAVTFFVFPYRAEAVGADLAPRVRELAELGHEIAQHTHFYAGKSFLTERKYDDLSDANVIACLERDLDALRAMGVEPRGFTAGAWQLPEVGLEALLSLGFQYDCSARHPQPGIERLNGHHRWLDGPSVYSGDAGRLLLLPTTCSLGGWFKSRHKRGLPAPPDYQMVYLHDYDLLASRTRLMLRTFLRLRRRRMDIDAQALASDFLAARSERGQP
jgi:hypothetical protein